MPAAITRPSLEADAEQQAAAENVAYAAPEPVDIAPAPVKRAAAPAPAKEKSGMSVGVIAGAAVAAVTLLAAGISIVKSGGKGENAPQKAAGRPATASKAASKPGSRSATARYRLLPAMWAQPSIHTRSTSLCTPNSTPSRDVWHSMMPGQFFCVFAQCHVAGALPGDPRHQHSMLGLALMHSVTAN